ncbi:MAG: HAD hydrolase-like protein, partial [Thermomicrobiales bacterium]
VIFDWGRTLWDSDTGALFPDVVPVLDYLAPRYRLAIVSLAAGPDHAARVAERQAAIAAHRLAHYFDPVIFAAEDKDRAYVNALRDMGLLAAQVAIVDDRARRGIRWGNQHGALTIWFRNGKFADELPDDDTGPPAHIIARLAELGGVL